jgi:hypothetical protein
VEAEESVVLLKPDTPNVPPHPSGSLRPQERQPKGVVFGVSDLDAEDFPIADVRRSTCPREGHCRFERQSASWIKVPRAGEWIPTASRPCGVGTRLCSELRIGLLPTPATVT